ncbi:MAG TPA: signal peptidase I [Actinomycetota bacterium]|nr:signal peptidase I [Actinomycetota bacterium]
MAEARDLEAPERLDLSAADPSGDEPTGPDRPAPPPNLWRRFVGSTPFLILVAFVVAILVKTFLIQAFYIPSESMTPTLEVGDRVFVNKVTVGDVGRGQVIVFENPHPGAIPHRGVVDGFLHWLGEGIGLARAEDEDFIKRAVGLPGETIEIRDDVVYIDGGVLDEPYLPGGAASCNGEFPPTRIPQGNLFVMGDNRCNSADSRYGLGFVPVEKVIGRAFVVIWPPSHFGGIH